VTTNEKATLDFIGTFCQTPVSHTCTLDGTPASELTDIGPFCNPEAGGSEIRLARRVMLF
jgi:hypothetical protein